MRQRTFGDLAHRVALGTLAAVALAGLPGAATQAQLVPCPKSAQGNGLKVMLDDIYFVAAAGTTPPAVAMDRLAFTVERKLRALKADLGDPPEVVLCLGRKPRATSDFSRPQVDQLNASNVVLVVWGTLEVPAGAPAGAAPQALVGFAVIPVRFYEHFVNSDADLPGVYQAEYTLQTTSALLEQSEEFRAYVAIGMGLKSLKLKNYDRALKSFCRAQYFLQPGGTAPTADTDQSALLAYARKMTKTTVEAALHAPAAEYSGGIRALDPAVAAGCGQ
jgi:hypothetical protein